MSDNIIQLNADLIHTELLRFCCGVCDRVNVGSALHRTGRIS